ncbi:MAG: hypothetical protein C5B44_06695 [Acidobacteria bacterium]|nr:MAG: hypothetical protein C5B44_06695 [Acidobacteriota bacterium]
MWVPRLRTLVRVFRASVFLFAPSALAFAHAQNEASVRTDSINDSIRQPPDLNDGASRTRRYRITVLTSCHSDFAFCAKPIFLFKSPTRVFSPSIFLFILLPSVFGQAPNERAVTQSSPAGIQKRWNEFGVFSAISIDAVDLIARTPDARFGNIALRYGRVLVASKTVAFEWTIDAVPLAILSNSRFTVVPQDSGFVITQRRKSVYGWGASPIGLKFNFRRDRRIEPWVQARGGALYFNEQVPVAGAARFNFTADLSSGVQIVNRSRRSLIIGYKFQHISNGYRAPLNPGVDVQMIFLGFSVFK